MTISLGQAHKIISEHEPDFTTSISNFWSGSSEVLVYKDYALVVVNRNWMYYIHRLSTNGLHLLELVDSSSSSKVPVKGRTLNHNLCGTLTELANDMVAEHYLLGVPLPLFVDTLE